MTISKKRTEKNMKDDLNNQTRCGYVGIIGRSNVGKSTLLNYILGQKISITSRKPQTTRQRILGIKTQDPVQAIYIDTPGMHKNYRYRLNRLMNRFSNSVLNEANVLAFVITSSQWTEEDEWIIEKIKTTNCPVILVINKIDKIKDKAELLPLIEKRNKKYQFVAIIPLSARTGDNVSELENKIAELLPVTPYQFSTDGITTSNIRFLVAEIVREKIIHFTSKELPFSTAVEIEKFERKKKVTHIAVLIWVERPGQKAILIGVKGEGLKKIGRQARLEIEALVRTKVFLQLWVKVKENWVDNEYALKSLGYEKI